MTGIEMYGHVGPMRMKCSKRTPRSSSFSAQTILLCLLFGLFNLTLVLGHVKLNVPRVRLPYFDNLSINFTLEVDTPGCYKWTVSRPDIITITYIDQDGMEREESDCSDRAVISTIPRVTPCCPANAIVYAEEVNTMESVRCDIIVDKINYINIVTTTKELHMEEAPSKFNVRGYGGMNNEFSTMEGVAMNWWLVEAQASGATTTTTDPHSIMRFMSFSESWYKATPAIAALEARRLQGSQVLVEGLKTGSVNVFAKISDPQYKNIAAAQVRIVVVANLMLDPQDIYVVPGTVFPLRLLQMKHGNFVEISLPSTVYSFDILNETVASYNVKTSMITARAIGETKIVVTDKNWLEGSYEEHSLTAVVHVRDPSFLSLQVMPFRNWALILNQRYEISVELYDSDNQKIWIGDNIQVKTTFESTFFNVEYSSPNGTYHYGTPIKVGSAQVKSELMHIKQIDGSVFTPEASPRVQAEMNIFKRITVDPPEVILPWDSRTSKKYERQFTASGGTEKFNWKTTNSSVMTITQNGLGKTEFYGYANVTAAMPINTNIKGEAKVYVLPPIDMKIIEHIVEAEVGTAILIPVALYTIRPDDPSKTKVPYSSCKDLPFKVEVEDPSFHYDSKTEYPHIKPACVLLPIMSTKLGSTLVTVTYDTPTEILTVSVLVSAFKPLKVVEPKTGTTVLAVGSSRHLVFEGGPRPLLERSSGFFRKLHIQNQTVAQSLEFIPEQTVRDDVSIYEVTCKDIGETLVTLHKGNSISKDIQDSKLRQVSRTAEIKVICAEPAQIYFKVENHDGGSKCPNDVATAQMIRIPIPNYENTMISVIVKDEKGRKFDNITSLTIDWKASMPLVTFAHPNFITTQSVPLNGYNTVGKNYQIIIPSSQSGNVEVTAEIAGYRTDVLRQLKLKYLQLSKKVATDEEDDDLERTHSADLQLVSGLSINPPEVNLFNHPSSKSFVRIVEGSGYFEILPQGGDGILDFKYHENNKTITITPITDGDSKIIVKDLCIFTHRTSQIIIRVNGVGRIDVDGVSKLQLNQETIVRVTPFDKSGRKLSREHLNLINLRPNILTDILEIDQLGLEPSDSSTVKFRVRGKSVGQATLTFTAESPGSFVESNVKRIMVYPPLIMEPSNITLLVGSVYQLISHGGPQMDALTNFTIDSSTIADINTNGLIEAKAIGRTKIQAKSVDRIPITQVFSEDTVNVFVVALKGIRIQAPILRIQKNYEMPLWVVGTGEGLNPAILLGGNSPLLSVEWQINNKESGEIIQAYEPSEYDPPSGDQLSVRFRAKQPGQVLITVIANYSGNIFKDKIEIEIHDELKLVKFAVDTQSLLMAPNSELSLKTNRDASTLVSYHVQSSYGKCHDVTECQILKDDNPVVTVDSSGIVHSFDLIGQAIILISVQEHFGIVQTLTVTIEVKHVTYIMVKPLLPETVLYKDKLRLPKSLIFPLDVTYHDNVGKTFASVNGAANVRLNRFDLVQVTPRIENQTFSVQTLGEGRVCIKVYDRTNPALVDFLILSVGGAIENVESKPVAVEQVTIVPTLPAGPVAGEKPEKVGWWGVLGFLFEWGYILIFTPLTVLMTLAMVQLAYKYNFVLADPDNASYLNDSVFVTSPKTSKAEKHTLLQRHSPSGTSFGDGQSPTSGTRLFSTHDTGYSTSGFRQRSSPHLS